MSTPKTQKKIVKAYKKCNNPEPDFPYGKDELGDIHFYCENCRQEVIQIKKKGEKKYRWYHGKIGTIPIIED